MSSLTRGLLRLRFLAALFVWTRLGVFPLGGSRQVTDRIAVERIRGGVQADLESSAVKCNAQLSDRKPPTDRPGRDHGGPP
jgi:hypothetical protein